MRNAFAEELTRLADQYESLVLLSGDIGNRLFDGFKAAHPDRFINCGVAESNMISMAAGMALCGLRPVTYTIASFTTSRCFEQIRVDVCYHHVPVTIVGVGAGMSYAANGGTHHCCEDIATLRALPGMTVVCPADALEVRLALRAALEYPGPLYLRLGKKGEPAVHRATPDFAIGKGVVMREGADICFISTGTMVAGALEAAEGLAAQGISVHVIHLHTIKPLDTDLLHQVFHTFPLVVTIEEHSRIGGLGGGVAEWLADQPPMPTRLYRIGTGDTFMHEAGEQEFAREYFGLTPEAIVRKVLPWYEGCVSKTFSSGSAGR
jgi:transketolase